MKRSLLAAVLLFVGCTRSPVDDAARLEAKREAARKERLAALDASIAAAERAAPAWKAWLDVAAHRTADACVLPDACVNDHEHVGYEDAEPSLEDPTDPSPLAVLIDLERQLREHGVDFFVAPIPMKSTLRPELEGPPPPEAATVRPDLLLMRFYRALERHGIEVLDMVPAFRAAPPRTVVDDRGVAREELFFRRFDAHFTSRGYSLAADLIGARIRKYPWFAEAAAERGRVVFTEDDLWVDDLNKLQVRKEIFVEHHLLHRVIPTGGRGDEFVSDPRSPVVLLGDSFAEFESSVGRLDGLADHLLRVLGFRVDNYGSASGSQYATRVALRNARPGLPGVKVVVYEISAQALRPTTKWKTVDLFAPAPPSPSASSAPR